MIFKDISNFNNVNDYLPILNGCLNADLIIVFMVFHGLIKSVYLKKWYKKFNLSASIADILILFIGIIIARFLYHFIFTGFNIWLFTLLAVCIQIIHDMLFYWFFTSIPVGYNYMLDFFKLYAKEVGAGAILGDTFMMILACLLSSYSATFNVNMNIISLVISCYFVPYMIYYEI
jgi:hypothetical protein